MSSEEPTDLQFDDSSGLDFDPDLISPIDFDDASADLIVSPAPPIEPPPPAPVAATPAATPAPAARRDSGRALVSWKEGNNPGVTHVVPLGLTATIGRDPTCAISIFDKSLSRQHATLASTPDGKWVLRDPGSANGTLVNGKKIRQAVLTGGDRICFGRMECTFHEGDYGDERIQYLEGYRLAIRKKLVALAERPDFLATQLEHRLQPWMRDTKVMLLEPLSAGGEHFDAFSMGTLVLPPDARQLQHSLNVRFLDYESTVAVPPSRAAIVVPEIEPIGYLAGRIGQDVPLDPYTWGSRRMVVLTDLDADGVTISMGHTGKLDVLAVGSGQFDIAHILPIRLAGHEDRPIAIDIGWLGRVVDEFEKL